MSDPEPGSKRRRAANALAGESSSKVSGQVIVKRPVVPDELLHIRCRPVQQSRAGETNLLDKSRVFTQQVHRLGHTAAAKGPVHDVGANPDFMPPKEITRGKLKSRGGFDLAGGTRPGVEEISCPAVWREQHRLAALPVRVAVETRVTQRHAEQRTRRKAVCVGDACGKAFAVVVRRSGLGT